MTPEAQGPPPRGALGVVMPFDMELDAELWRWLPAGVDLSVTRTPFLDDVVTVEFAREVAQTTVVTEGVRSVTAGRADVVVYACASGSFVRGRAGQEDLVRAMTDAGSRDAVTTSGALVEALGALGITRVSTATPYVPALSLLMETFLAEYGVTVTGRAELGLDRRIWEVPYAQTAELIRRADTPDAEAVVVSCTNLPTYDLIAQLEVELGKPIITANQATMWAGLRRLGKLANGEGQSLLHITAQGEQRGLGLTARPRIRNSRPAVPDSTEPSILPKT
ncbi:Asp/Glu/hydantoin racemase [Nesterenkonia sp. LB17]|uniref:maleate cis-trans isomerase family protein n=1 Tax=unclassified Nesterenkonia TaxID=2629769 RepID=UPI001F4C631A|nr:MULTISPECIES: Asp/Glu/hydantoin racemase [unclassified Nesterenkonia]MCH8559426.1 Asp/Glu/hydantoin racemase [Nesterenkonia sp. DZ6]MCH8563306.1 Asp/Glu/hydantoin racemase [Nesterenkonia sp. YGD6]MCH8564882.1 Asp/Glu/hydantoin racemase [Nesterenkonia sp. LB17]MCH8572175.1 Asp/Glu/hydantoin racemase [Nesterenkonia sp. AY15]